ATAPDAAPPATTTSTRPARTAGPPSPSPALPTEVVPPPPPPRVFPKLKVLDAKMARTGHDRLPREHWNALSFNVASFNVLGASHTQGPRARPGYARAEGRLPHQLAMLENKGITVAG